MSLYQRIYGARPLSVELPSVARWHFFCGSVRVCAPMRCPRILIFSFFNFIVEFHFMQFSAASLQSNEGRLLLLLAAQTSTSSM